MNWSNDNKIWDLCSRYYNTHHGYHTQNEQALWVPDPELPIFWMPYIRTITHSRPKFKIILIKKVLLDTSQFYMVCQNSWMILVFPIQIFWTLVVFTIQFFWQLCFDRFFVCFIAPILNFCQECYFQEILTGVIVFTKVLRHARSQSPLTHWVLRPLQKLLCTHIYILR